MAQQMRAPVQPMQAAVLAGQPLCFRVAPAQRRQAAGAEMLRLHRQSAHPVALAGMLRQFGFRQIAQRQGRAQRLNVAPFVLAVHQIEQGRCRVEGLAVAEHGQIAWRTARQGQQVAQMHLRRAGVSFGRHALDRPVQAGSGIGMQRRVKPDPAGGGQLVDPSDVLPQAGDDEVDHEEVSGAGVSAGMASRKEGCDRF